MTVGDDVLERLHELRKLDAPTHGGSVLSYVYDAGDKELEHLADAAATIARPLNGLDPTAFPSIARMERDVLAFARRALNGGRDVVGSVTSGGTESCLLAVKTARDLWREQRAEPAGKPELLAPETAHAAFRKAAEAFDLIWTPVPCEPDGSVSAEAIIQRMNARTALVVVSAPAYPSGALDPVTEVAGAARRAGISCHVDACFGGFALPWWPDVDPWDFRVPGVTSISSDLHKFGYAPKGVSVLLHRGRKRHRRQFFATTSWPGYPVVNPTLLGSKSASPLAAAWAIMSRLGDAGYGELTSSLVRSAAALREATEGIHGLAVWGDPVGPSLAAIADSAVTARERVDPHHFADEVARHGFSLQHQPGFTQANGVRLPPSVHLTITPVTERRLSELRSALDASADRVRGKRPASGRAPAALLGMLGYGERRQPGPAAAWAILRAAGAG
ncbi:aminotransferase class V-fold PLP-dependent enzyme, partial [uncultured Agrococcus sp.]|uniref:pyridoxal phosphate-dependent decarboxylase family protein n=1 Tax=uncultured Agrococcus sp. TaxID=382258 RepID=UPI0025D133DF